MNLPFYCTWEWKSVRWIDLFFRDDDYWLWLHYSRDCLWFLVFKILFMIVREILHLDDLPLYVSWEPFYWRLVFSQVHFSLFLLLVCILHEREKLRDLIKGSDYLNSLTTYSKIRAVYGIALIVTTYILAFVVGHTSLIGLTLLIPFSATFGTYYFSVIPSLVF